MNTLGTAGYMHSPVAPDTAEDMPRLFDRWRDDADKLKEAAELVLEDPSLAAEIANAMIGHVGEQRERDLRLMSTLRLLVEAKLLEMVYEHLDSLGLGERDE